MRVLSATILFAAAILAAPFIAMGAQAQDATAPAADATPAVSAAPATPASTAAGTIVAMPAASTQASDADLDKIVCRQMAPPTGTRLGGRRECMTQRQWNDVQQQSRKAIEDTQQRSLQAGVSGN